MLIYAVKAYELKKLEDKNLSKAQREFSLKVLKDLPKIDHLKPLSVDEIIKKK